MSSPFHGAWLVLRKEIREALRDRNLVLQVILLPLFLFPLMGLGGLQVYRLISGAEEQIERILWIDNDTPQSVRQHLLEDEKLKLIPAPTELQADCAAPDAERFRALRDQADENGEVAPVALLSWWRSPDASVDSVTICFDASLDRSVDVRDDVTDALKTLRDVLLTERAESVGLSPNDVVLWEIESENVATSRQMGQFILSMMLPMFLIMMLGNGSLYSALDTIVGERERGTFETLLSSPLRRSEIMLGKFAFVTLSSLVTFSLNLFSVIVFATFAVRLVVPPSVGLSFQLGPVALLAMLGGALLCAMSLAALMMLAALPANNYRAGQAVLTPIYMAATFSSIAVMTPSQGFSQQQALIPFVNVAALCKAAIGGNLTLAPAITTYAVMAALAFVSMFIASRVASRDGVVFDPDLSLKKLLREGLRS